MVYDYLGYVLRPSEKSAFHCARHPFLTRQHAFLPDLSKALLLIFQEQVLVAHRVKYVQNIYFHISLFYKEYPDFYQKVITLLVLNC